MPAGLSSGAGRRTESGVRVGQLSQGSREGGARGGFEHLLVTSSRPLRPRTALPGHPELEYTWDEGLAPAAACSLQGESPPAGWEAGAAARSPCLS